MARLLLSWLAHNNDFRPKEGGGLEVDPEGTTASFHRHFFAPGGRAYDRHLLLTSGGAADARVNQLVGFLRRSFPDHPVEAVPLGPLDVIDVPAIQAKVERLLLEHREDEMDLFISPGTPAMFTAWCLAHAGLRLRTRLLQTRPGHFTRSGLPELVPTDVEQAPEAVGLTLREAKTAQPPAGGPLVPPTLEAVYERARRVAATDRVTALIRGESGTGKERLAEFIHASSARAGGPFLTVNCAAWRNEALLESRLFGYAKGAFTGADRDTAGLVEEAGGGTLFLDEIGDVSPAFQATLLRFMQQRAFSRIGEAMVRTSDARVIVATHRDLVEECRAGRFRWDLYYRLAVAELELPPLRAWAAADVGALVDRMVADKAILFRRPPVTLSAGARSRLLEYAWPGNVRELENVIEALYVFAGNRVGEEDLPPRLRHPAPEGSLRLEDAIRAHVRAVYDRFGQNKERTARALGISVNTLKAKLETKADPSTIDGGTEALTT